jgi:hypothetical protein
MKPMRERYELKRGRLNPYVGRLGAKGRAELLRWWSNAAANVRVLPDDVAREFPDSKSTTEALRFVMKLRKVQPAQRLRKKASNGLTGSRRLREGVCSGSLATSTPCPTKRIRRSLSGRVWT